MDSRKFFAAAVFFLFVGVGSAHLQPGGHVFKDASMQGSYLDTGINGEWVSIFIDVPGNKTLDYLVVEGSGGVVSVEWVSGGVVTHRESFTINRSERNHYIRRGSNSQTIRLVATGNQQHIQHIHPVYRETAKGKLQRFAWVLWMSVLAVFIGIGMFVYGKYKESMRRNSGFDADTF